ncbi:MAG TPA: hypothetical protein VMM37_01770 [Bacteroidota bacterium]|nr:hypothetical protein [Bacteroidota bacterium]
MAESLLTFKRLDWKWVWITLGLYILFYFLPIYLIGTVLRPHISRTLGNSILAMWFLGGNFIIAAVAGYKSNGVTIWEPVVSSVGAVVLMYIAHSVERAIAGKMFSFQFYNYSLVLGVFFSFSLVGAVCGELLQQSREAREGTAGGVETPAKFQWIWVVITLMMYVVLYLFPLYLFGGAFSAGFPAHSQRIFSGTWIFAGIIVTAGLAGFMSRGITLWEPVVGSVGFILILGLVNELAGVLQGGSFHLRVKDTLTTVVFFFLLSLLGAWLGELWQKTFLNKER